VKGADPAPPRIYYVHPLLIGSLDGWDEIFDHAAEMGFDTVLTAPPFEPGHGGSIFLPRDMERLHPVLGRKGAVDGIARLADMARTRNLALALDVVVDRVAADSAFARDLGLAPFIPDILDPRQDPADREAVIIPFDPVNPADHPYIPMLAERLRALAAAGVSAFRCLHWDKAPPAALERLIAAVRGDAPEVRFLAWTPGASLEAQQGLRGAGFDGTFSSLRWWDLREGWIAGEHELHRSIGYEIAFPEAPFDKRLAQEVETQEVMERRAGRALWLAATLGDGILVPMGFEYGCRDRFDPTRGGGSGLKGLKERGSLDLAARCGPPTSSLPAMRDASPARPCTLPWGTPLRSRRCCGSMRRGRRPASFWRTPTFSGAPTRQDRSCCLREAPGSCRSERSARAGSSSIPPPS
jgi:starch synthase (maltosyl-transferring)